jgi:isopenicillin-N N-acyltransferase like protein
MTTPEVLPFASVRGTWSAMGEQVGQIFAPLIGRHLDAWLGHVVRETGASRDAVVATAQPYARHIQAHAPFLWEELGGMARGSGIPLAELLVLQARAEVLRAKRPAAPPPNLEPPAECTTFALGGRRAEGGGVFFGQNVDLVPFLEEFGVIVRQQPREAPATLMYMTAGLLGHNGLNEAGVGVCANFVDDPGGWGDGLPRYLLSRLALREESAEAALAAAMRPPRAASRNLLVADARGNFVDAELLRGQAGLLRGADGLLVHANHLEAPEFQGYETPTENSLRRRERLEALLTGAASPLTVADLQRFYRDHANAPHSLCAHPVPGRNVQTVVSVIGDLGRLELHAAKGAPCRAVYATYTIATCRDGSLSVIVRDEYQPVHARCAS